MDAPREIVLKSIMTVISIELGAIQQLWLSSSQISVGLIWSFTVPVEPAHIRFQTLSDKNPSQTFFFGYCSMHTISDSNILILNSALPVSGERLTGTLSAKLAQFCVNIVVDFVNHFHITLLEPWTISFDARDKR